MKQSRLEILAGAFVLLFVTFILWYLVTLRSMWGGEHGYVLRAQFNGIEGINIGSPVYLRGVRIGKVQKVALDPKTYAVWLDLLINSSIKIPSDSSANIVNESLIGGKQLAIVPGGSNDVLKPHGIIPYTQSSLNMETLLIKAFMDSQEKKKS